MDPNETLRLIDRFLTSGDSGDEVDEWCESLREWIARGGFEPEWEQARHATSYYRARIAMRSRPGASR